MSRLTNPELEPSVTCGFFNSENLDRTYNSRDISSIFDGVIKDGVFLTIGECFDPKPSTDVSNAVTIGTGKAWFDHTWTLNDAPLLVQMNPPELIQDRIDAVVIEINDEFQVRDNFIKYVKGTPSSNPQRPTMIKTTLVHQYPICYIRRKKNVTTISNADITKMVGSAATPFVTGVADSPDFTNMLTQWRALLDELVEEKTNEINDFIDDNTTSFNNWADDIKTLGQEVIRELQLYRDTTQIEMNDWMTTAQNNYESEFFDWFNNLKLNVNENSVTNLQEQIGNLKKLETVSKENLVAAINWLLHLVSEPSASLQNPLTSALTPAVEDEYYETVSYEKDNYYRIPFPSNTKNEIKVLIPIAIASDSMPISVKAAIVGFTSSNATYNAEIKILRQEAELKDGSMTGFMNTDLIPQVLTLTSSSKSGEKTFKTDIRGITAETYRKVWVVFSVLFTSSAGSTNSNPDENYLEIQISDPRITGTNDDYKLKGADADIYNKDYINIDKVPLPVGKVLFGHSNVYDKEDVPGHSSTFVVLGNENDIQKLNGIQGLALIGSGNVINKLAVNTANSNYVFGHHNGLNCNGSMFMFGCHMTMPAAFRTNTDRPVFIGSYNLDTSNPIYYNLGRNPIIFGGGDNESRRHTPVIITKGVLRVQRDVGLYTRGGYAQGTTKSGRLALQNNYFYDADVDVYTGTTLSRALISFQEGWITNSATMSIELRHSSQYLLFSVELNSSTGAVYGYRARLISTPLGAVTSAGSAVNLGASANAGVTITLTKTDSGSSNASSFLNLKTSTTCNCFYRVFLISASSSWSTSADKNDYQA